MNEIATIAHNDYARTDRVKIYAHKEGPSFWQCYAAAEDEDLQKVEGLHAQTKRELCAMVSKHWTGPWDLQFN